MPNVTRDKQMAWLTFAVAAIGLVASVLLLLMFLLEVPFNGPYVFGAGYEVLTAVGNALTAALVLYVSQLARPSVGERVLAPILAVLLVVGAGSAILLVTQTLGYVISVAVSVAVLVLEGIWLFWLNRRLQALGVFPPSLATFGWLIGAALFVGLPLAGLGLLLPSLTFIQLLVLGLGVFLAGGAWLILPVWWVLVGVRMMRGQLTTRKKTTNGTASATTKERGRRKA